jgi:hypothetical protein
VTLGIVGLSMETAANSSSGRASVVRRKDRQKSRITNGSALLPSVDGRSAWVRRCKDVIAAHLSDLPDASVAERSLVRRAAVLTTELERLEVKFATAGEAADTDLDMYIRASGNLRRLLEAVGLQRRARDVGPTLADAIRQGWESNRDGA